MEARLWLRVALATAVLLVAIFGIRALVGDGSSALSNPRPRDAQPAFKAAQSALHQRQLPPGIVRAAGFTGCNAGDLCGRSALTPPKLVARLRGFIGGRTTVFIPGCRRDRPGCPVTIEGRFHGLKVAATAFWNLMVIRHHRPPPGAKPAISKHLRARHPTVFYRGSDVVIELDLT